MLSFKQVTQDKTSKNKNKNKTNKNRRKKKKKKISIHFHKALEGWNPSNLDYQETTN